MNFQNENDLFKMMAEKLYSAVISDLLDQNGFRDQAMSHQIRPIHFDHVTVGRAMTVLCTDVYQIPDLPYQMEIEAVDALKPNDVLVCTTNGSDRYSFWGELLSTAAIARGANGAVIDGFIRDTKAIIEIGFPVFCTGFSPLDSNGRGDVVAYNVPIKCGGVAVDPGDIIFADHDGIVVIPKKIENEIIRGAIEKISTENQIRDELRKGSMLKSVFDRYGVL